MNEERMKILEMLSAGNISVDEAMKLLSSIEKTPHAEDSTDEPRDNGSRDNGPRRERSPREYGPRQNWDFDRQQNFKRNPGFNRRGGYGRGVHINVDSDNVDFDWVNDLRDNLTESVQNVAYQLDSAFGSSFDFGRPTAIFTDTTENITDEINSIKLKGKNDKLEIIATDDTTLLLEAFFKPKHNMDPHLFFEKSNGNYSLLYDSNAVHSMGIRLRVPKVLINDLYAETKNSDIYLRGLSINSGDIITKNSTIQADNISGSYLALETKNAPIYVINTNVAELEVKTTNAKTILNTLNCNNLTVQTTNGPVKIEDSDIRYILAKATNAGIRLENMASTTSGQYPKYSVDIFTINSNISIDYPGSSAALKVNASTTSGRINCSREDLEYTVSDKNYIDAVSKDFNENSRTLDIKAQTTNGNINIMA